MNYINTQYNNNYNQMNNNNNASQKSYDQYCLTPDVVKIMDYKNKLRNKSGGKFTSKFYKNKKMLRKYGTLLDILEERNNYIENQKEDEEKEKNNEKISNNEDNNDNTSNNSSRKRNTFISKFNEYKNMRTRQRLVASMDFNSFSSFKQKIEQSEPLNQNEDNTNIIKENQNEDNTNIIKENERKQSLKKKYLDFNVVKNYKKKFQTMAESEESIDKEDPENLKKINNIIEKQKNQKFNTLNSLIQNSENSTQNQKILSYKVKFGRSSAKLLDTNQTLSKINKTGSTELLDKLVTKKYKAENDQNIMTNTFGEGFYRNKRNFNRSKIFENETESNSPKVEMNTKNSNVLTKKENKKTCVDEKYLKPKINNYLNFSHFKSQGNLIKNENNNIVNNNQTSYKNVNRNYTKCLKEEDKENVYQKKRTTDYDYEVKQKNNNDYDKNITQYKNKINNNNENNKNINIINVNIKNKEEIKAIKKK